MLTRLATTAATIFVLSGGAALAEYPEKPISLIVPWAAGGGTDAVARVLAEGLKEELGVAVNVVNKPGGGSVIGHSEMLAANPDGYTLGFGTAELATFYWAGQANTKATDFNPIALVNFDSGAFHVSTSSKWSDVKAALEDIKAQPAGTYKVTGTGTGAAYHLAFAGFLKANGIDPLAVTLVPSQGAAPGFQELAAGGVDVVLSSLPEGTAMMQAGKSKPLAVFSEERIAAFPDVPTAGEATGTPFAGGTWRGVVGPQELDPEVKKTLEEAVLKVANSEDFKTFMNDKGFGVRVLDSAAFGGFLAEQHTQVGVIMNDLGIAQRKE
ncbi:tripartite-type tricarboxylate transporter receptor subunit TctC [Pseudorhizobium tarimense]|uniref:Tripartite-type tricarboxylate transporter receptor subunit TctC n=1 Tax=Pseudorhizobium tarimense TaxID=1079109 RepID=A0ABV2HCK2_9HYPH|nr:tripartite tricarboxylate transporter substrate binding protein [Pseudorhizobium tarimense]MCJ8520926.1 tripartite tricarboxylate transporter substrate binding protein [Pseudorhizobium tarimense]